MRHARLDPSDGVISEWAAWKSASHFCHIYTLPRVLLYVSGETVNSCTYLYIHVSCVYTFTGYITRSYDHDLWAYKLARRNKLISQLIEAACVSRGRVITGESTRIIFFNDDIQLPSSPEFSTIFSYTRNENNNNNNLETRSSNLFFPLLSVKARSQPLCGDSCKSNSRECYYHLRLLSLFFSSGSLFFRSNFRKKKGKKFPRAKNIVIETIKLLLWCKASLFSRARRCVYESWNRDVGVHGDALQRKKGVPPSNHTCKFPLIDASMHPVTRTGDGWTCSISRHDNNKQLRIIGNPL